MSGRSSGRRGVAWALAAVAFALLALLAGCGGSDDGGSSGGGDSGASFTGDAYPGVDVSNTRFVGGPINRDNVAQLKEAWSLPLTAQSSYGSISSTPVVANGVAYV